MYFVKSKIGPSESCDTSYSDHWEMDNQGSGSKNGYNTNTMECGEQTIYCAFEEYGLEWYSLLFLLWIPLMGLES